MIDEHSATRQELEAMAALRGMSPDDPTGKLMIDIWELGELLHTCHKVFVTYTAAIEKGFDPTESDKDRKEMDEEASLHG